MHPLALLLQQLSLRVAALILVTLEVLTCKRRHQLQLPWQVGQASILVMCLG